ncbi:hypothetical protein L218DRAFT_113991 [Marasmius fiardii PR-910]|nr:hypothetical protein L218DRAFT_113991 [Marasmius fiardii PR-910]
MSPSTLPLAFLFEAVFFFSLTCRSQFMRRACFLCLLWSLYATVLRQPSTPPSNADVGRGTILILQTLSASDLLVLTKDLHRSFRRLHHKGDTTTDISSTPFMTRLIWGISLVTNPRGIGWAHGNSLTLAYNRPPHPLLDSQRNFLIVKILMFVAWITYFRLSSSITRSSTSSLLHIQTQNGLAWEFVTSVVYVSRVVAYCNALHLGLVVLMVGVGVWDFRECPSLFGDWMEGYTLRNVWGRVWHQLLRRILESHASFILSLLRISPTTSDSNGRKRTRRVYYIIRSLIAIVLSGLLHQTLAYISPPRKSFRTVSSFLSGPDMQFFLSQAIGIVIESCVVAVWRTSRSSWRLMVVDGGATTGNRERYRDKQGLEKEEKSKWYYPLRLLGYLWVLFWISWTVKRHMDGVSELGLMHDPEFDPRKFGLNPPEMWKLLQR